MTNQELALRHATHGHFILKVLDRGLLPLELTGGKSVWEEGISDKSLIYFSAVRRDESHSPPWGDCYFFLKNDFLGRHSEQFKVCPPLLEYSRFVSFSGSNTLFDECRDFTVFAREHGFEDLRPDRWNVYSCNNYVKNQIVSIRPVPLEAVDVLCFSARLFDLRDFLELFDRIRKIIPGSIQICKTLKPGGYEPVEL